MTNTKDILYHSFIWILYFVVLYLLFEGRLSTNAALLSTSVLGTMHIVVAYFNTNWLIPRFYLNKNYFTYTIACIALVLVASLVFHSVNEEFIRNTFSERPFKGMRPNKGQLGWLKLSPNIWHTVIVLLVSLLYKISKINSDKEKETTILRSENLISELNFLRSQINPHFLFNAMNNLYALSETKSAHTSEMILKLSEMLRYNLYETENEITKISQEVGYIKNYIAFHKIKIKNPDHIVFENNIERDHNIAPMLLIPFIENAFKHSKIENDVDATIGIYITTSNNEIIVNVSNTTPQVAHHKDKVGGIGIQNVKRRLELLYKDRYNLSINKAEGQYVVELRLLT